MPFVIHTLTDGAFPAQRWEYSVGERSGLLLTATAIPLAPVVGVGSGNTRQQMLLLAGSRIPLHEQASCEGRGPAHELRERLIREGEFVPEQMRMWYETRRDLPFSSPGLMATVVAGASKDGWKWVSADDSTLTLKEAWSRAVSGDYVLQVYQFPTSNHRALS